MDEERIVDQPPAGEDRARRYGEGDEWRRGERTPEVEGEQRCADELQGEARRQHEAGCWDPVREHPIQVLAELPPCVAYAGSQEREREQQLAYRLQRRMVLIHRSSLYSAFGGLKQWPSNASATYRSSRWTRTCARKWNAASAKARRVRRARRSAPTSRHASGSSPTRGATCSRTASSIIPSRSCAASTSRARCNAITAVTSVQSRRQARA